MWALKAAFPKTNVKSLLKRVFKPLEEEEVNVMQILQGAVARDVAAARDEAISV